MKLYKYMNLELGEKFVQVPILRLSGHGCLNDPFEFRLTANSRSKIEEIFNKKDWLNKFWSHGIISLTETYDNLLMWSHYSDEHKGVVIEISIDDNNPFSLFRDNERLSISKDCTFNKVNYRKFRKYNEEISEKSLDDVRLHYMLSKSDEWMYEKEYRYVIHHSFADLIFIKKDDEKIQEFIHRLKLNKSCIKDTETHLIIAIEDSLTKENLFKLWILAQSLHEDVMFFKIILPDSIGRIYLGYKSNSNEFSNRIKGDHLMEQIRNKFVDDNGSMTNIYKASLSTERFELDFEKYTFEILSCIS